MIQMGARGIEEEEEEGITRLFNDCTCVYLNGYHKQCKEQQGTLVS
jgi:hypothetical protein